MHLRVVKPTTSRREIGVPPDASQAGETATEIVPFDEMEELG